jgi:Holliday junction resolvase RusA-like endonuclease
LIEFTVYGTPGPQGSKSFKGLSKRTGHAILVENSKLVAPWREAVLWAFIKSKHQITEGPVAVEIVFTLKKPASAPKRQRTYPAKPPDLDKLERATWDALSRAGAWEDDSRVLESKASKRYPNEGDDALPRPGAVIRIWSILEKELG